VFKANMDLIHTHNTFSNASYSMGMNEFGDQTLEEFVATHNGFKNRANNYIRSQNGPKTPLSTVNLPTSVDWRTKNAVTPIKNQGQCGSCWAFSTTGSTEGAHAISTGKLVSLSEQQLVDCSQAEGNQGCEGGLMDQGFEYIINNKGISSESAYPYTAQDGTCMNPLPPVVATISSYTDIPTKCTDSAGNPMVCDPDLQAAVAAGPVSIAIEADQSGFQFYSGGVFSDPTCGLNLDHGVLVVGYGTDGGKNMWIVKNSWGTSWGVNGYIEMIRGKDECGMNSLPSYPVV